MIMTPIMVILNPIVEFIIWTLEEAWRTIVVSLLGAGVSYGIHRVATTAGAEIKY